MTVKLEELGYDPFFESGREALGLEDYAVARVTAEHRGAGARSEVKAIFRPASAVCAKVPKGCPPSRLWRLRSQLTRIRSPSDIDSSCCSEAGTCSNVSSIPTAPYSPSRLLLIFMPPNPNPFKWHSLSARAWAQSAATMSASSTPSPT